MKELLISLRACVATFVVCAMLYPAVVWALAQVAFPRQAEGSLIHGRDGDVIGSELIAQPFASDKYFHPRPSAADYKADAASGSNLGPNNPALRDRIVADVARLIVSHDGDAPLKAKLDRLDALQAELKAKSSPDPDLEKQVSAARDAVLDHLVGLSPTIKDPVPVDLVTASGGGLDPHISPEAAYYQAGRVASARGLPLDRVRALIESNIEHSGAVLGAPPRVNVLLLNLAIDEANATGK
jgi:K+-transporting ATPase ATPase C chain